MKREKVKKRIEPLDSSSSHGPHALKRISGRPPSSFSPSGSLSELDRKILQLNRAGQSIRAIVRAIQKPRE